MPILFLDYEYADEPDVLIRVYPNQDSFSNAEELFCGEILFRDPNIPHQRFTAPYPRGIVDGIATKLRLIPKPWNIQVSNELFPCVGHLTSCREHFDTRIRELLNENS